MKCFGRNYWLVSNCSVESSPSDGELEAAGKGLTHDKREGVICRASVLDCASPLALSGRALKHAWRRGVGVRSRKAAEDRRSPRRFATSITTGQLHDARKEELEAARKRQIRPKRRKLLRLPFGRGDGRDEGCTFSSLNAPASFAIRVMLP
jgi:hypothetical protein